MEAGDPPARFFIDGNRLNHLLKRRLYDTGFSPVQFVGQIPRNYTEGRQNADHGGGGYYQLKFRSVGAAGNQFVRYFLGHPYGVIQFRQLH